MQCQTHRFGSSLSYFTKGREILTLAWITLSIVLLSREFTTWSAQQRHCKHVSLLIHFASWTRLSSIVIRPVPRGWDPWSFCKVSWDHFRAGAGNRILTGCPYLFRRFCIFGEVVRREVSINKSHFFTRPWHLLMLCPIIVGSYFLCIKLMPGRSPELLT